MSHNTNNMPKMSVLRQGHEGHSTGKITVLRLGHRKQRDKRITTHCALVARALGADEIILSGEDDPAVIESVQGVVKNWGGNFKARYEKNWKKLLKAGNSHQKAGQKPKTQNSKRGTLKVHLTFYGMPLQEKIAEIRKRAKRQNLMVVVGAEKVPSEVYQLCDYNISVTNQPHSEVAALAIFLHEFFGGKELEGKAQKKIASTARLRITPMEKGKKVERRK